MVSNQKNKKHQIQPVNIAYNIQRNGECESIKMKLTSRIVKKQRRKSCL